MRKGFTLVELLVVVAIIGILASILVVRLAGHTDKARVVAAKAQVAQIEAAVIEFQADTARLPTSLDELVQEPSNVKNWKEGGYLKRVPDDPWGNPYIYRVQGAIFEVISLGADGSEGGDKLNADISSESL